MAANNISTLATKEERQIAKLELAQTKRQLVGTPGYRDLRYYDVNLLPTKYSGNDVVNNSHPDGPVPGRPWKTTPNTVLGLWRTTYDGYFNADNFGDRGTRIEAAVEWFDTVGPGIVIESVQVTDFSLFDGNIYSTQWLGYFRAPHTANYTFYSASDDEAYFWIGDKAITGYTAANADLYSWPDYNGELSTDPIALTEGQYYPIRLQYGNAGGGAFLNFSWSDDYTPPPPTGATIQVSDLQYAGAQWTGSPSLVGSTYTNGGWDYIGFNNAGLYNTLFGLLGGDGKLAVTWSVGSTAPTGYVNVNFDGNTTFQFVPVVDAGGSNNYPGSWVFPATFSVIP